MAGSLTVCRQVVDERGQERDEHAGNDYVHNVEQRFASNDKVKCDILVLVAFHWYAFINVSPGRLVNNFPLAIFCKKGDREGSCI